MTDIMTIDEQIRYHLEYNLAAPIPQDKLDGVTRVCVHALAEFNAGHIDELICVPRRIFWHKFHEDARIKHKMAPAGAIIDDWKLYQWLAPDWHDKFVEYENLKKLES